MSSMKTRINRITIGRLHNLGDYEHVRYEISVDVAEPDDPQAVLLFLERTLNNLQVKSGISDFQLRMARESLAKPAEEQEQARRDECLGRIQRHENAQARRRVALENLSALGGVTEFKDAKLDWEDDYPL